VASARVTHLRVPSQENGAEEQTVLQLLYRLRSRPQLFVDNDSITQLVCGLGDFFMSSEKSVNQQSVLQSQLQLESIKRKSL
jgi:hypothetical protein